MTRRTREAALALCLGLATVVLPSAAGEPLDIDFQAFLARHDMTWDRVPDRWELAPFAGNGNIGFLLYRNPDDPENAVSIHVGRHDYYDHRLPYEGDQMLWIYRSRLPLGRFQIRAKGKITGVDWRLDLWNAELRGTVTTTEGAYTLRAFAHATLDVLAWEFDTKGDEALTVEWLPDAPMPPVRATLDAGGGPTGGTWDRMRKAPLPMPPQPERIDEGSVHFCRQILYAHRGETTVGWQIDGDPAKSFTLLAGVHHSFPEQNSLETVRATLVRASRMRDDETFLASHRKWWHEYYPQSFLTLDDPEKEAFYWIQMYKLASAMRGDGPILDLMGPWYHKTFWPMVWGDLNVQVIYWTHLTANRLELGESLLNNLDKYAKNLEKNVPEHWTDSASISACFPQDLEGYAHGKVPDMLAWILHDYWLHCVYAGDRERLKNGLFPLLRKTVNAYFHYLEDNPTTDADGKIHIANSWSPEYPGGHGRDINFTIALFRWSLRTLIALNDEFGLDDPSASKWQATLDKLVDFQVDENGLRIGRDIPFDRPHRHFSHLLAFYPLALLPPDDPAIEKLLRTSVDHWLDVTFHGKNGTKAMPFTGYTLTGAACMYAWLGDGDEADAYLDRFLEHERVSPTTMYAEGNPVIESPLSFATAVHEMLLQSWGDTIRVFHGTPQTWKNAAFHNLRTRGAFLVSAKKKDGLVQCVSITSLAGNPCRVQIGMSEPVVTIDGKRASPGAARRESDGTWVVALPKGSTVTFTAGTPGEVDCAIRPLPVAESQKHLFGYSRKTARLPGHRHYAGK
ncbi:hypothetical protein JCM19992_01490 [Thermostilla marina]